MNRTHFKNTSPTKIAKVIFTLALVPVLSACTAKFEALNEVASEAVQGVTCSNSQNKLFNVSYKALLDLDAEPSIADYENIFSQVLLNTQMSGDDKTRFLVLIKEFYSIMQMIPHQNKQELLAKVSAAEIGSQESLEAEATQKKLKVFEKKWQAFAASQDSNCQDATNVPDQPIAVTNDQHPISFSGLKVMATAYQSCDSVREAPLDGNSKSISGVQIIGTHPNGVGKRRVVSNVDDLMRTDPYYQKSEISSGCYDVRKFPMIYDYGGKPVASSDPKGKLNYFSDAGSGTSVLGVDCAGYVFSAIAVAGLRLSPGKQMKGSLVYGLSARMFMEPEKNGLSCFAKLMVGQSGTVKAGDIISQNGHVVLVDSVGADPLGILSISNIADCGRISVDDIDFIISQSSPSIGGVGINRFVAKDYLKGNSTMRAGVLAYAQQACRARLSGQNVAPKTSDIQIVRHKMTSDCLDQSIHMQGEACVEQCFM